jgi:hypothetical protein
MAALYTRRIKRDEAVHYMRSEECITVCGRLSSQII